MRSHASRHQTILSLRGPEGHARDLFDIGRQGSDGSFFLAFSLRNMCLRQDLRCREVHLPAGLRVSVLARQATLAQL